jgi:acyl-CoA reductase-like NAD-dependent aldehyde dehydrogenase
LLVVKYAAPATTAFDAFVKEVAREMTLKAGQKCTAIRRVLAPATRAKLGSVTAILETGAHRRPVS